MSILIKGMEMPKEDTMMILSPDGTVTFMDHETAVAVEIHEPHGRLIDADAMIHDIEKSAPMCSSWYVKERNADMIKFLSIEDAIIPAEEGE